MNSSKIPNLPLKLWYDRIISQFIGLFEDFLTLKYWLICFCAPFCDPLLVSLMAYILVLSAEFDYHLERILRVAITVNLKINYVFKNQL